MISRPIVPDATAAEALDTVSRGILKSLTPQLQNASWTKEALEAILTEAAAANGIGFGKLAGPLRAALAGRTVTPSVYDMMLVIGRDETIAGWRMPRPDPPLPGLEAAPAGVQDSHRPPLPGTTAMTGDETCRTKPRR